MNESGTEEEDDTKQLLLQRFVSTLQLTVSELQRLGYGFPEVRLVYLDIVQSKPLYSVSSNAHAWATMILSTTIDSIKEFVLCHRIEDIDLPMAELAGRTTLSYAVSEGNVTLLSILLIAGANVNAVDDSGNSPLLVAADNGSSKIASLLLACNAQVDLRNNEGITPLLIAVMKGRAQVVPILLQAGADVEWKSADGWNSLLIAAARGLTEIVAILLVAKANVNIRNIEGETALILAVKNNHIETISILIFSRADPQLKDNREMCAYDHATSEEARMLLQGGIINSHLFRIA